MLTVECPSCRHQVPVTPSQMARGARCTYCGQPLGIGEGAPPSEAAPHPRGRPAERPLVSCPVCRYRNRLRSGRQVCTRCGAPLALSPLAEEVPRDVVDALRKQLLAFRGSPFHLDVAIRAMASRIMAEGMDHGEIGLHLSELSDAFLSPPGFAGDERAGLPFDSGVVVDILKDLCARSNPRSWLEEGSVRILVPPRGIEGLLPSIRAFMAGMSRGSGLSQAIRGLAEELAAGDEGLGEPEAGVLFRIQSTDEGSLLEVYQTTQAGEVCEIPADERRAILAECHASLLGAGRVLAALRAIYGRWFQPSHLRALAPSCLQERLEGLRPVLQQEPLEVVRQFFPEPRA